MNTDRIRLIAVSLLGCITTAHADVVTDWNTTALNAIRGNKTPPPVASRGLAILHTAMYDAVNGIARTHEPYLVPSTVPASASKEAAASAAAHRVLTSLFPTNAATFDALHASTLAGIRNGPQKQMGVTWGQNVAAAIMTARANDGWNAVVAAPGG